MIDLHMHTTYSDGRDSLSAMVNAAAALGYEYIAITDHSARAAASRTVDGDALARQRDDIARRKQIFVPLDRAALPREAVRARELPRPDALAPVGTGRRDVDEHVRVHELELRHRARDRDGLLEVVSARPMVCRHRRGTEQRCCQDASRSLHPSSIGAAHRAVNAARAPSAPRRNPHRRQAR